MISTLFSADQTHRRYDLFCANFSLESHDVLPFLGKACSVKHLLIVFALISSSAMSSPPTPRFGTSLHARLLAGQGSFARPPSGTYFCFGVVFKQQQSDEGAIPC